MRYIYCSVLAGVLAVVASAAEPKFQQGVKLNAGDKPVYFEVGHLVPSVTDWNGDGMKDLIVGHFTGKDGNMKLFLNQGTDSAPVFKSAIALEAGGKPIQMDAG
jgi:hypothetical protein